MRMQIWSCLCERFADDEKKALSVFLSRKWRSDDLLECEHDVVKCQCSTCHGSKKCAHTECELQPYFNDPIEKVGIFCKEQSKDSMVDLVNKVCEVEGCKVRVSFNQPGIRPAIRCDAHQQKKAWLVYATKCAKLKGASLGLGFSGLG